MEVSELVLWIARLGVLALMYLFLLALILALRADARATAQPRQPEPSPPVTPQHAASDARYPVSHGAQVAAPARAMTVVGGTPPTTGNEYSFCGVLDIGRDNACAICLPSRFVSTHHARIYAQNGVWMIEDLGSTNGTLLNGQPLLTPHLLTPGDRIVVGDTEFAVK